LNLLWDNNVSLRKTLNP